jgi:hypothetical protein
MILLRDKNRREPTDGVVYTPFWSPAGICYHCFDRVVIHGYLSGLSRPGQVAYFFRDVVGEPVISKEVLSRRTNEYQAWVEAFALNHCPLEWAGPGVRKEDYVRPALRRMEREKRHGVYFILKSMEQGNTFRSTVPKFPTTDPNRRILARQRSRFTHYYFYIRDETLGPMVLRVASFFPFQATYYLNGHSFIENELIREGVKFRKNDNGFPVRFRSGDLGGGSGSLHRRQDSGTPRLLDSDTRTEVLQTGALVDESAPLLYGQPDRILPKFHFQTALSDSQDLRARL